MTELLNAIDYHGKRLSETPTYSELQCREVVRQFVGEAVGRMYSLVLSKAGIAAAAKKYIPL